MDPFRPSRVSFTCKVDFASLGAPKSNGSGAKRGNFWPNPHSDAPISGFGVPAPQIELSEGRLRGQKCKTYPCPQHTPMVWLLESGAGLQTL